MRDKKRRQRQKTIDDEIKVFNEDQLTMESHADETMNFEGVKRRVQRVHSMGKKRKFVALN
jgi:hypothetical protein